MSRSCGGGTYTGPMRLEDLPPFVHYARGPGFRSAMDLEPAALAELLEREEVHLPGRFSDPSYLERRREVERRMSRQLVELGFDLHRDHPFYGLVGRSERAEKGQDPKVRVHRIELVNLPRGQASFTWGDSYFLGVEGRDVPSSLFGRVFPLEELVGVVQSHRGREGRPSWMEVEIQLWSEPVPGTVSVDRVARRR